MRGRVVDTAATPIASALVTIVSEDYSYAAAVDARGDFEIRGAAPGLYALTVRAPKYQPLAGREISVTADATTNVQIVLAALSASGIASLGRIEVNGENALSTASAPSTELDPQDLAGRGVEQLSQILGAQVGVTLTRPVGGQAGLPQVASLRGPDPSETLIEIDGHEVNNANTGDFDLELLDPSEFTSVQVVYGIGPSSLGGANTQGGAINFRTLEPTQDDRGLARFSFGSFGTSGETLSATGTDERIGYALSWHRYYSQGWVHDQLITDDATGAPEIVGSAVNATSGLAKLRYNLANDGFVELTYRNTVAYRDLSAPLSTPDDPNESGPGALFKSYARSAAISNAPAYGIDVQLPVGRVAPAGLAPATIVARHLQSLVQTSVEGAADGLSPWLIDGRDLVTDDSLQYDRQLCDGDLTFSGDIRQERFSAAQFAFPSGAPASQGQTQRSLVGRYEWSTTRHLHYTAAAYVSRFDTFGTSLDPRVAFVWMPTSDTVVRASAGSGFRAPLLTERAVNPNLTAEHTTEYELGYEHRFGAQLQATDASFSLYRTNLRDPIFFTNPPLFNFPINVSNVVYQGVELSLNKVLGRSTRAQLSYGYDGAYPLAVPSAVFDPAAPTLVANQQFQGIAPHKAVLALRHDAPNGVAWTVDGRYESANNPLNRPTYAAFDASGGITRGHTQLTVGVRNLTDVYPERFTLAGAGLPYPGQGGVPVPTDAYALGPRALTVTVTERY